ncbi:MAG TPA: glycosyltransferase family 2 protein [Blastocatellia bacterium]|nr:glycosyltransferase family 2 protein [Blastocatellia bacterium]
MTQSLNGFPLSVLIPAKNEEHNIAACLESVSWADEIWVVDSHSTDRTVEIASRYTDRVVQFDYAGGHPKKKNWALENLPFSHEWVLILDCDERVTPELKAEIIETLGRAGRAPGPDGYYLNRQLIFLGRWIKHCGWYPSWNLRLFKHRLGRYERLGTEAVEDAGDVEAHEHVVLHGRAGYLRNDLLHEDCKSLYHFIERHNRYSNWEAQVYYDLARGEPGPESLPASLFGAPVERKRLMKRFWTRLPMRPLLRFIWMYVLKLGFLDGRPGFIFCLLLTMHEAVISAKLYEQELRTTKRRFHLRAIKQALLRNADRIYVRDLRRRRVK